MAKDFSKLKVNLPNDKASTTKSNGSKTGTTGNAASGASQTVKVQTPSLSALREREEQRKKLYTDISSAEKTLNGLADRFKATQRVYEKNNKKLEEWVTHAKVLKQYHEQTGTEESRRVYELGVEALNAQLAKCRQAETAYQTMQQRYSDAYSRYSTAYDQYRALPETPSFQEWADAAQLEYDAYIRSPEYSRSMATATRQKMLQMAMTPGASVADAPLSGVTVEDSKEKELRSLLSYYKAQAQEEKNQAIMKEDLEAFGQWPMEDQLKMHRYIENGMGSFNSIIGATDGDAMAKAYVAQQELIEKYGKDTVDRIMESVTRSKNQKNAEDLQQVTGDVPDTFGGGTLAFAGARAANLMGNISAPIGLLTNITRPGTGRYSTLDPNNPGNLLNELGSGLDAAVVQNIRDVPEGERAPVSREVFATLYQAGASAADSYLRVVAGGGNKAVSRALIASGTFGRNMSEYSGQGASPTEALLMSTFDAGLELLTEEISLDRIIQQAEYAPANFVEWLKNAAISGGIEVSEEEMSFIGSTLLQAVVMGDKSAYNQQIGKAVAGGKSYQQAKNEADAAWLQEGAMTAIQSFLSGGMMSGTAQTSAALEANQLGKDLNAQGVGRAQTTELMEESMVDPGSNTAQVAEQIRGKEKAGKQTSTYDQGRLYQAALQEGDSFGDVVQRQIQEGIRRKLGFTEDVETGGEVTVDETATGEVSDAYVQSIQRLANITGRKIHVYSKDATATGIENGIYKDGTIYINAKGKDPYVQTFSHEMTHSIEMSDSYDALSKLVFQRIRQQGVNLESMRAEKKKLYAEQGVKLDAAGVDKEIVAQYVADHLLTDERSVLGLVQENRSIGQKIKGWLDKLLAKLGNGDAQERVFLENARNLYARALEQTSQAALGTGKKTVTTAQSPAATAPNTQESDRTEETGESARDAGDDDADWSWDDYREALEQDLAAGRITEDYYDEQMEFADQQEELERNSAPGGQYSFAGVNAKNADLQALETAKEMEQQDVSAETIRQRTGWFRGKDGKWSLESAAQNAEDASVNDQDEVQKNPTAEGEMKTRAARKDGGTKRADESSTKGYDYTKSFAQQIDDYKKGVFPKRDTFLLGKTPDVLTKIGLARLPLTMNQEHVDYAINGSYKGDQERINDHILNEEELTQIPALIADPVAIIQDRQLWEKKAREYSIDVLVDMEINGKKTLVPVNVNSRGHINGVEIDSNRIQTVHGNTDTVQRLINALNEDSEENVAVFYINKEKAAEFLRPAGNPISRAAQELDGFIHSVTDKGSHVKMRISSATESQQFKRWFGDWQNHPENASKIVNADGTPKVVYHGSYKNFSVFDGNAQKHSQSPVAAHFFTDDIDVGYSYTGYKEVTNPGGHAYKGGIYPVYLNIRNPYVADFNGRTWSEKVNGMDVNETAQYAKDNGYDGLIVHNVIDEGGNGDIDWDENTTKKPATDYVVFDSEQIKSATHNIGTFDGGNPDIRYSFSPVAEEGTQANQQVEADPSEAEVRVNLPAKARGRLERAEHDLENDLGNKLYVPHIARRSFLRPIVQELSNAYLKDRTVDQEKADLLFDKAFAQGIIADAEFYDQYKDVKKKLRTTAVTLGERNRGDIADYNLFKRDARWDLKITDKGGLPVDVAYMELREMAPELFPESITHPADQLQHMFDVSRSIRISEKKLTEAFGDDAENFRAWAKGDFQDTIRKMAGELRKVKRYGDEAEAKKAAKAEIPGTVEEVTAAYNNLKDARKAYERVQAKVLLTDEDNMAVGRLLRGEILPEHLDSELNTEDILKVYEAKKAYEEQAKPIGKYRQHLKDTLRQKADSYLETAMEWTDKKFGLAYSRETMRRNVQDIIKDKKLAKAINDEYFEPVHTAEAAATRFKNEFRDKIRAMDLSVKPRKGDLVSEAHAVQLYGEAMDNIEMIRKTRGRMKKRDGKTETGWQAVIEDMFQQSPSLDRGKIERSVEQFRKIYDDLYTRMNEVRVRNGYEPVNYRHGYFPHFQPGDGDGMLLQFGKALGIDTQTAALPTTINGLTHTFRPGIQWFGHAQERLGFNTAYDAVEGFDKYIEGVANVIYQTENIQKLRALESQIRYRTSEEGIRKQVDAVDADNRLTEDEKRMKIDDIYKNGKFALSNFVNELTEYTNLLAGKKSRLDRGMEAMIGRKAYTIMKNFESRVGANMIAGNLSSALTNFIPLTQAGAQLDRNMILKGMWNTLKAYKEDDGLRSTSDFLTNRRGSDALVKKWTEKASDVLGTPMELIDGFVTESIVRAAYEQNLKDGMSEAEAMYEADIFASGVMADRSRGAMPTLFESRNPVIKAFTQFQLEVNNQFSEVFKDLPRRHREKGLAVLTGVLFKYFLGAFLYNEVYEFFVGRRPAMDPIGILNDTAGDWLGYELPNLVEMGVNAVKGEEISLETEKVGGGEAVKNFGGQVLGQLPFSSGLALLGVETDGGRIPASSAIPDLTALWDAATTEDWSKEKRWQEAQKELNKLAYVIPPFGGGQISKTWKGVKAFIEGGSYSVDSGGNDILQYPVFREEDGFGTFVQAALLGKSSLPAAQEWVEGGFDSLSAKQTAIYKDLVAAGAGERDSYKLIRKLETVEKTDTQSEAELQRELLMGSDVAPEARAIAYYGMLASEKDRELMDAMADQGADSGEVAQVLMKIQDAAKLSGAAETRAKRDAIADSALTDEEKTAIYREKISDSKEDEISQLRAAGLSFDDFLEIQNEYSRIEEEYSKATEKATAFSHWVNQQGYTDRQADAVKDSFKYFSMYPATAQKYDDLVNAGLSESVSYDLVTEMDKLQPKEGKSSVDDLQKYRTIIEHGLNEKDQLKALEATIGAGLYERVTVVNNAGVTPAQYLKFREILPSFDANGNGNFSQSEIKAALDSMGDSGEDNTLLLLMGIVAPGEGLTNAQKAAIWQSYNKSWKPKNNPYDKEVGRKVYQLLNAEDAEEQETSEATSLDFGDEVMRQILESLK